MLNSKYGCWLCNGIAFKSKIEALKYASQMNIAGVQFYFHDHVWDNFDRNLLGKISLDTLYKERAQQLRDHYKYLILHYSGGSDSHNILQTFLKNNIKLDEVMVRWPKPLRDGKLYKPNTEDKTAKNAASEWDFAIKPTLDWLAKNRPDIKINIVDYGSNIKSSVNSSDSVSKILEGVDLTRGGLGTFSMFSDHNSNASLESLPNTSICHIFGIDKPIICYNNNKLYFHFLDVMFESSFSVRNANIGVVEPFYWAPDFPLLTMEQAYQSALYFKHNPQAIRLLMTKGSVSPNTGNALFEAQSNIYKSILYKNSWDFRFQVGKPNESRSDWYFWLFQSNEFETLRKSFSKGFENILQQIDGRMVNKTDNMPSISTSRSKMFHILDLEDRLHG